MIEWLRRLVGADVVAQENRELREMLRATLKSQEGTIRAQQKTLDRVVNAKFDPMEIRPQEQQDNSLFPASALSDTLSSGSDAEFLGVQG